MGQNSRKIAYKTFLIFFPIFTIIAVAIIFILLTQEKLEKEGYKNEELRIVDNKLKNIESEIEHVIHDLLIFTSNSNIERICKNNYNPKIIENITSDMYNVVTYNNTYDQARFINDKGMEIIRINYNNGYPIVVEKAKLQNKKNRYYFYDSFKLNKEEVFISPMDLNIEKGKLEQPLKPMIRFGTPVFDDQGSKYGIMVFNFLAENILKQVKNNTNSKVKNQQMLLNAEGYILKGPKEENEWGFMYADKKHITFSTFYINAWEKIKELESSQFETEQGLFTFKTIYPLIKGQKSSNLSIKAPETKEAQKYYKDYYWKIVSFVPSNTLYFKQNERRQYVALLLAFFSLSLLYISWRLAKVQRSRAKALASLKVSNETKDKFFSIIAHDLKGPFNVLFGFSNILKTKIDEKDIINIAKYNKIINSTLKNTYDLLDNLLKWSMSQTNRMDYNPESIILFELVNDAFNLLKSQADKKEVQLENRVPEDLKLIADKNMIGTVLRNLLSNSLKYSNTNGTIKVAASITDSYIRCTITDTGVGMSDNKVKTLFSLSDVTSTPGTHNEKGTGLGLILCKELIEKHKGTIGLRSELGKGSSFWFEIPIQ